MASIPTMTLAVGPMTSHSSAENEPTGDFDSEGDAFGNVNSENGNSETNDAWRVILNLEDLPPSQQSSPADDESHWQGEVIVGGRVIAVFRVGGHWYAIDGMCAHQGGPLASGSVQDGCVTCPWHGWQYDLGNGVQTINRQPLQEVFPIREHDGNVEIRLPEDE